MGSTCIYSKFPIRICIMYMAIFSNHFPPKLFTKLKIGITIHSDSCLPLRRSKHKIKNK